MMVRSWRAAGNLARAREELVARLAQQPTSLALQLEMGAVALEGKDVAAARRAFQAALNNQPGSYDAQAGLVATELRGGSIARARALVDGWLQQEPASGHLRVLLAKVQLAAADTIAAERTLRDVVVSDATQLEAYDLLGRLYMAQGQLEQALTEYQTLSAQAPHAAGPLTVVGLIHEAKGDQASANAHYSQALEKDPAAGVAANNLAWAYAEEGRLEEALALAHKAQRALRNRPEAEHTVGWIYLKRGQPQDAIGAFERAIAHSPQRAVYHYHLGLALAKTGNTTRAVTAFRRALTVGLSGDDAIAVRTVLHELESKGRS
jgi:tetratricopeptide (TPR) repeat protein